jgi:hypothetical protein
LPLPHPAFCFSTVPRFSLSPSWYFLHGWHSSRSAGLFSTPLHNPTCLRSFWGPTVRKGYDQDISERSASFKGRGITAKLKIGSVSIPLVTAWWSPLPRLPIVHHSVCHNNTTIANVFHIEPQCHLTLITVFVFGRWHINRLATNHHRLLIIEK